MAKPKGRGQLSSLDTLPEWADQAKMDALAALKERRLSQETILDDFNTALRHAGRAAGVDDKAIPQISRSAFNRAAMRLSILGTRLAETREIANVLAPRLDQAGDNSLTLLVAETIKTLALEMLGNAGELAADGATAEMLSLTARALASAEQAKRISSETRQKIAAELHDKAKKAVDQVGKAKGLSAETVEAIKAKILGVEKSP